MFSEDEIVSNTVLPLSVEQLLFLSTHLKLDLRVESRKNINFVQARRHPCV